MSVAQPAKNYTLAVSSGEAIFAPTPTPGSPRRTPRGSSASPETAKPPKMPRHGSDMARRPRRAGRWAAAGAARQASATSAAIDRILAGFAVSGLALDPRGVRRGLPGAGVGAQIASARRLWLATIFGARQRRPKLPLAFCPHCIKRTVPSLAASHGPSHGHTKGPGLRQGCPSGQNQGKGCHSAAPAAHSSLASL